MVSAILTTISAVCGVVALVLQAWVAASPARKEEARNEEIQDGRQDIADGNADAVTARIDSVCSKDPGSVAVLKDDEDTARRLAKITGE